MHLKDQIVKFLNNLDGDRLFYGISDETKSSFIYIFKNGNINTIKCWVNNGELFTHYLPFLFMDGNISFESNVILFINDFYTMYLN